jgi:large subunit ribosomal protein L10
VPAEVIQTIQVIVLGILGWLLPSILILGGFMKKEEKKVMVEAISEKLKKLDSTSLLFLDFKKIKGKEVADLRKSLKKDGVIYRVVKTDLLRIAARNVGVEIDPSVFRGNVAMAITSREPNELAKKFVEIKDKEENSMFDVKGGFVEGKWLTSVQIVELSKLPLKPVLVGKLLYFINSPLLRLVTVLSKPERDLVTVLGQVKDKKEQLNAA